jgi:osmotically-inducible protein OsmY
MPCVAMFRMGRLHYRLHYYLHHGFSITSKGYNMTISKRFATLLISVLLFAVAGCASTSKSEGTGEYVDDTVITSKVKAEIFNEPALKSREINVETFKGVTQLSGFVTSQADVNKAVEVASRVKGVKSVRNDMKVK